MNDLQKYKYEFQLQFIKKSLILFNSSITNQIMDICKKNAELLNINPPTFLYKGLWYPVNEINYSHSFNKKLHPSLIPTIEKLLTKTFKKQKYLSIMQNFFNIIIENITNQQDLKSLLPDYLYSEIKIEALNYFNCLTVNKQLALKQFNQVKQQCKPALIEFNKLQIINILKNKG